MVLGSKVGATPAILLFASSDLVHWDYRGPLLEEPSDLGIRSVECPDFFPLDGTWVAVGALMSYTDPDGRYQPTRYRLGRWDGTHFTEEYAGTYDFGGDFYAVQSFEHAGRRIALGWVSDFYGEHRPEEDGAYGSFTLPRELSVRDGRLCQRPVREVYALRDRCLWRGTGEELPRYPVPGNAYWVKLQLTRAVDFCLLLGQDGDRSLSLVQEAGEVSLRTAGVPSQGVRFRADLREVRTVEVFVDRRTVEVYLEDGAAAGTKLFCTDGTQGVFQASFADPAAVGSLELWSLSSAWKRE